MMRIPRRPRGLSLVLMALLTVCGSVVYVDAAGLLDPSTYLPTMARFDGHKRLFDDPRPHLDTFGPRQVLPPALYARLRFDVDEMKRQWADLVGLVAPQEVGKIAPEVRPGRYSYKDLDAVPGLRALMYKDLQTRVQPGGPPFAGSIPEFEIIPTRQYYWALPITAATRRHRLTAALDAQGYLDQKTWQGGFPFPRPDGPFKAQQVMYNVEKRVAGWDLDFALLGRLVGYTDSLRKDFRATYSVRQLRLAGRSLLEPFGFLDAAARERAEAKAMVLSYSAPRDYAGAAQAATSYLDPDKPDALLMYLPAMRKVRKLAPRDTQDDPSGLGRIYDDGGEGINQKLSATRYPYRFEVLEEREFLVPAPSLDGAEYLTSTGAEFRNIRLERRPLYVVKLTQQDPAYVYGSRILYVDKETFVAYHIENYDQKGNLYRTWDAQYSFFPDMGMYAWTGFVLMKDHAARRSSVDQVYNLPAQWSRRDIDIEGFIKTR